MKYRIRIYGFLFLISANSFSHGLKYSTHFFDVRSVTFTGGFWKEKQRITLDSTIPHCIEQCTKSGRVENFKNAALHNKIFKGKFPFDDSDLYKTIEAVSYALAIKSNPSFEKYLDTVIAIIVKAQEKDGYIQTMWSIDSLHPTGGMGIHRLEKERLGGSHELYNVGHLYEAAVALSKLQKRNELLEVAKRNADYLYKTIVLGKLSITSGHPEIEIGLMKLYSVSRNSNYIDLVQYLVNERGNPNIDRSDVNKYNPWSWPINLVDHKRVKDFQSADGHAVRALYLYGGVLDLNAQTKNKDLELSTLKVWENLISKKLYVTGGAGANHLGEAFSADYDLPNQKAYSEGCASVGNILFQSKMYEMNGDPACFDVLERTLYNSFLAITSENGKKFFYVNPLESDTMFKFNHGTCKREGWFDVPCCPPNVGRMISQLGALQYAYRNDTLFVNSFSSNTANLSFNGINVSITQTTDYPWDGEINIAASSNKPFYLAMRIPGWVNQQILPSDLYQFVSNEKVNITANFNKKEFVIPSTASGYNFLKIDPTAKNSIKYTLPLKTRYVKSNYNVVENSGLVAINRGPLVFCLENSSMSGQFKNLEINTALKNNLIEKKTKSGIEIIYKKDGNNSFVFMPYYQWSNNGTNEMKVWIRESKKTDTESVDVKPIPTSNK